MIDKAIHNLKAKGLVSFSTRRIDLKHLLSAERAARGSFYATRVGFVAINRKGHRIARAHNGFPHGVTETRERWSKSQKDFYHLHAECAGIFHAARHGYATQGATAYVTHPPCPGCMRALIAAQFARIVFSEQALLERLDWREDMVKTFEMAQEHKMKLILYRDAERSMKHADITRTEVQLKVVYDALLPQARWSSTDKSEISPFTRPESGTWYEQPVVAALIKAAAQGKPMEGAGLLTDYLPECRAATAMIQAGVKHLAVLHAVPDPKDVRWAAPLELARAEGLLRDDAKIRITVVDKEGFGGLAQDTAVPFFLDARYDAVSLKDCPVPVLRL